MDSRGLGIGNLIYDDATAQACIERFREEKVDAVFIINCNFGNEAAAADIAGAQEVGMDSLYIHSNISPSEYGKKQPTYAVLDGDFTKIRDLILN